MRNFKSVGLQRSTSAGVLLSCTDKAILTASDDHELEARFFVGPGGLPMEWKGPRGARMVKTDGESKWSDVKLLYDSGVFSVIAGFYDGGTLPAYGLRWNGNPPNAGSSVCPNELEQLDWFLLPQFLAEPILHALLAESLKKPRFERHQKSILQALGVLSRQVRPNTIQRAIALYGASNTGKTMTLNILIDLLSEETAKSGEEGIVAMDSGSYNPATKTSDRSVAIRVFGKLVAIVTSGDYGEAVQKGIDFALRVNADILVSATRKRSDSSAWGAFYDFVRETGIYYEAIEKTRVPDADMASAQAQKQAEDLFNRIRFV